MAIRDVFKVSWRTYFNPTGWIGLNRIIADTSMLWRTIRGVFTITKPNTETVTFEDAVAKQNLTEEDLQMTAKSFLRNTTIFVICGALSFTGSFYMLIQYGTFFGWLLANLVTTLFLLQALRFHVWYFQIKNRKLGCTFKEWWDGKVSNDEEPKP